MTCRIVDLPVPDLLLIRLMMPPLTPVNLSSGEPNAENTANACGSKPGLLYTLMMSRHSSNVPIGCIAAATSRVALDGGLYRVNPGPTSLSPRMKRLSSSAQPNCTRIISNSCVTCIPLAHATKYVRIKFIWAGRAITPWKDRTLRSSSLLNASTSVRENSLTSSRGSANRIKTVSPLAGSYKRFVKNKSYSYTTSVLVSSSRSSPFSSLSPCLTVL